MLQIMGIPNPTGLKASLVSGTSLSLAGLVARLLAFAILAAGLFFFVRLILAGYTFLTSFGDAAKIQAATKELTNAAIGLVIVVSAYFLAQIIQVVFGINILL